MRISGCGINKILLKQGESDVYNIRSTRYLDGNMYKLESECAPDDKKLADWEETCKNLVTELGATYNSGIAQCEYRFAKKTKKPIQFSAIWDYFPY